MSISIYEAQHIAEDLFTDHNPHMNDSVGIYMDIITKDGITKRVRWLDPFMGAIQIADGKHMVWADTLYNLGFQCDNVRVENNTSEG